MIVPEWPRKRQEGDRYHFPTRLPLALTTVDKPSPWALNLSISSLPELPRRRDWSFPGLQCSYVVIDGVSFYCSANKWEQFVVLSETSFRYSLCVVPTPWVFKSLKKQLIKKMATFSLLGKNRFLSVKYESAVIAKLSNTLTTLNCTLHKIYKCLDNVSYQKLL